MIEAIQNFLFRNSRLQATLTSVGKPFTGAIKGVGSFVFFTLETVQWFFRGKFHVRVLFREMVKIGVNSTFIIALVGLFSGMVFALQTASGFRLINAESLVGSTVGVALARELAPVFTALMIVARAGSSIAAEIGTMTVTEQVDALKSMAVHPINYLVVPRVLATTLMMPLLVGIFNGLGLFGAYIVSIYLLEIPEGPYMMHYHKVMEPQDFFQGLIKGVVFGVIVSLIACYKGYHTNNGAEGVGRSTTQAVVAGSVTVLVLNYFLTTWLLQLFP
ncbi:MAG: ABC transporter permease [Deltaproteobacteria bacterium]|nr:ABC transporter permease [Deltaproteobacteria bacterium]